MTEVKTRKLKIDSGKLQLIVESRRKFEFTHACTMND